MDDTGAVGSLLVVGELCVDLVVPLDEAIRFGQHEQIVAATTLTMGSSSAITACGTAALGIATTLVAVRGDDAFGRFLDGELRRRGVDVRRVRVDPATPTGASTHLTMPDGDRAILTAMGSIGRTVPEDVEDADLVMHRHLHLGSWFLQRGLWERGRTLLDRARVAGLRTSLDGNFDPEGTWDRGVRGMLGGLDVLFGNDDELCGIAGIDDADAAVASLLARMPQGAIVVHKLGARGARALRVDRGRIRGHSALPPALPTPLVDTVGAGDTLAAGYLAATLAREDPAAALALAVACGTASTRGVGGVGAQPTLAQARALAASVAVQEIGD